MFHALRRAINRPATLNPPHEWGFAWRELQFAMLDGNLGVGFRAVPAACGSLRWFALRCQEIGGCREMLEIDFREFRLRGASRF